MFPPLGCGRLTHTDLTSLVLHVGLVIAISFDWVIAKQQHMSNDAKTKQIAFIAIRFLMLPTVLNHLGSHVAHRPASLVTFRGDCPIEQQRKSEIDYAWSPSGQVYVDVLGFQVAMDYVGCVDVFDPFEDHPQDVQDDDRIRDGLLLPQGHQIFPRQVLQHHDIVVLLLI